MPLRTSFLIEKAISIPLITAAVVFLSSTQILAAFIVFGIGHIFVAFLYQYRAKKYSRAYGGLVTAVLLIALASLLHFKRVDLLIVVTSTVFLLHFLLDEVLLAGKKLSSLRALEMLPIILLYVGTLLEAIMHIQLLFDLGLIAVASVVLYALVMLRRGRRPDFVGTYFLCITALLLYITISNTYVPPQILIGVLVLLHYTSWYIAYYFKVRDNPDRLRSYLLSVISINAVVFVFYSVFLIQQTRSVFAYLFLPVYFYIWTLVHTLVSLRVADLKGFLMDAPSD